jgi:hypothetical protein
MGLEHNREGSFLAHSQNQREGNPVELKVRGQSADRTDGYAGCLEVAQRIGKRLAVPDANRTEIEAGVAHNYGFVDLTLRISE